MHGKHWQPLPPPHTDPPTLPPACLHLPPRHPLPPLTTHTHLPPVLKGQAATAPTHMHGPQEQSPVCVGHRGGRTDEAHQLAPHLVQQGPAVFIPKQTFPLEMDISPLELDISAGRAQRLPRRRRGPRGSRSAAAAPGGGPPLQAARAGASRGGRQDACGTAGRAGGTRGDANVLDEGGAPMGSGGGREGEGRRATAARLACSRCERGRPTGIFLPTMHGGPPRQISAATQ